MKFLFFLLAVVALTCCVGALIQDCGLVNSCQCEGVDGLNKTLITCDSVDDTIISLWDRKIVYLNANAFDNNTNMTEL